MNIHHLVLGALLTLGSLPTFAQTKSPKDPMKVPRMEGIEIKNVDPGSVYETMKIESGDTLLEVDHRRIQRIQEIEEIFRDIEPGQKVKFKVKHEGKVEERELELKRPSKPTPTPKAK